MRSLRVATAQKDQVLDITSEVQSSLEAEEGVCTVFAAHTTCAVTTADLDPGTDQDMLEAFRKLLPAIRYRHPHDPAHTPDHILATLIGPAVSVPVHNGRLVLGVWQRIVLIELDGPRERDVHVTVR
ncbi:MAG TPA: secondary thiamine-phosphate synthase enzyme YjbQ [Chloroflexota bacterium]|jgi:secondary thiamine-phosphate synthase enzyme|nr:secondary thiamine-phosphate synthase enzyme YjbQ [Chloroflexota bacterium]